MRSPGKRALGATVLAMLTAVSSVSADGGPRVAEAAAPANRLVATPASTAAPAPCSSTACGGWAVFEGAVRGAILARISDPEGDVVTITASFAWDLDYDGVSVVGSKAACAAAHASGDSLFAQAWDLDNDGLYGVTDDNVPARTDMAQLRSIRLFSTGGQPTQLACARAIRFETLAFTANPNPAGCSEPVDRSIAAGPGSAPCAEGAYASIRKPNVEGLVLLALGDEKPMAAATLALQGLRPDRRYTVFGSRAGCADRHLGSDLTFRRTFVTDADGRRLGTATIKTDDPYALRSIRIVRGRGTDGPLVACGKGSFLGFFGSDTWTY